MSHYSTQLFLWMQASTQVYPTSRMHFDILSPEFGLFPPDLVGFSFLLIFAVFALAIVELVKGLDRAGPILIL